MNAYSPSAAPRGSASPPGKAGVARGAVGFRNVAVHNYDRVDWAIVFAISTRYLDDFREFAAAMRLHG